MPAFAKSVRKTGELLRCFAVTCFTVLSHTGNAVFQKRGLQRFVHSVIWNPDAIATLPMYCITAADERENKFFQFWLLLKEGIVVASINQKAAAIIRH